MDTLSANRAIFKLRPGGGLKPRTLFLRGRRTTVCVPRVLFILSVFLGLATANLAAQQHPTEAQVKAAYLYNFGKFVTWEGSTPSNSDALEICVLGKDPFGTVLDKTVAGESIAGRAIHIRRINKLQDEAHCRIVFVSASEEGRLASILPTAQRSGILTVSDIPHFAEQGGIIEFVNQQDKIRFAVNRQAAEQSHLTLSSQLLKVASKVMDKSSPGGKP